MATEKDLFDRIREGEFEVKCAYPKPPVKPRLGVKHNSKDALNYAKALENYECKLKAYEQEMKIYHRMQGELDQKFKEEALEYCGLSTHPKKNEAFSKAYDRGHHAGKHEVLDELEELADLLFD